MSDTIATLVAYQEGLTPLESKHQKVFDQKFMTVVHENRKRLGFSLGNFVFAGLICNEIKPSQDNNFIIVPVVDKNHYSRGSVRVYGYEET